MRASTAGKLVAGAAFAVVAGIIAVAVVRAPEAASEQAPAGFVQGRAPVGDVTIVDLPDGRSASDVLMDAGDQWVFRSPDGEGREREYRADSIEPLEAGRIRLVRPSATIPIDAGRVEVTALEGLVVRRAGGEPESGELTGGVTVSAFRDGEGEPFGVFRTERISFQESMLEVRTEDAITVESPGMQFRGTGLTMRFGEARGDQPATLLYLRVHQGGRLETWPDRWESSDRARAERAASEAEEQTSGSGAASNGVETFYRVLAAGDVGLTWGGASIVGDRAEIVARLVDGALAPDAIRELGARNKTDGASGTNGSGASESAGGTDAEASPVAFGWDGPLEATLVEERPEEIAARTGDEVAIRWFGIGKNAVRASHAEVGFGAEASEVRYGATSARIRLTGRREVRDVVVRSEDAGELRSQHAEVDLGELPLVTAWVDGPGVIRPRGEGDAGATVVTWGERADLTGERVADDSVRVTSVSGSGPVRVIAPGGTVDAQFARVFLVERDGDAVVERVILRDGFRTVSSDGASWMEAERAEIAFGASSVGMSGQPEFVRASGAVRIVREDVQLDADEISASVEPDAQGAPALRSGDAQGSVRAAVSRGAEVRGPRITLDDRGDVVTVSGPGSVVALGDADRLFEVHAESMEVRRREGRITGAGPGYATMQTAAQDATPPSFGSLTWTDGFAHDDAAGVLELLGTVAGTRTVGDTETQRLSAPGGATVVVTPGMLEEGSGIGTAGIETGVTEVVLHGASGTPAEIEGRRYRASEAAGVRGPLESVLALRADLVAIDVVTQRLRSPGAGVLVVEDRREQSAGGAGSDLMAGGGRGTTAFRWSGAFDLDREAGRGTMDGGVRVSHLDAVSSEVTELTARSVEARFDAGTTGAASIDSDVIRALYAREDVRLDHPRASIDSDLIEYDAGTGRFTARSTGSTKVRGVDRQQGTSFFADLMWVNPATGELGSEGVTGITSGR